ncbi:hypothetical protein Tco_0154456 [Tanacetum coccineum]
MGTFVEYRKTLLVSQDASALDKPHFHLKNLLRRFIHESNPDDAGLDDEVNTSFQHCQPYYHMLIFKLQRHTFDIKSSRNQECTEQIKTKTFLKIQKTIGISWEIVSFQDEAKYEHVGPNHKFIHNMGRLKISELKTKSKDNDKGSRTKITKHEATKSTTTKFMTKTQDLRA